ncbi:recombinase XerD (plasmid) [Halostagnicola larsenii XH-48]|uniref:Recombinase XerD n=1 Tax=Halostagnicola larsenii XH-48 TaxID=797299 RepID=W0JY49_9EURY|nr:site-specific integrase [Halostagnicola larsenii]AHG02202.1 recombinase XerD [Halostagnicola larsenii XH-48]
MAEVTISDAIDAYLRRKSIGDSNGPGSGAYASNAESILRRWAAWLETERETAALRALDDTHLEAYAQELANRTERGTYAASTAHTYYAVVRAFLSWCVRGGLLEANPATTQRAQAVLPAESDHGADQFWTDRQRKTLEQYVRRRAIESTHEDDGERCSRLREYAVVALLAHTEIRGSELFRVPDDTRRAGATWDDVDFYTGTIRVLGKSQRHEAVPLPAPARTPLRRYRVALDPPTNEWPLFPTRHAPSIARHVRSELAERGYEESEIDSLLEDSTAKSLLREYAITPPAITTEGVRTILKRLCKDAGIDVNGEYLTPSGVGRDIEASHRRAATAPTNSLRVSFLEQSIARLEDHPRIINIPTSAFSREN